MGSSPLAAAGTALEDLPEDALLCILALLAPPDAAAAACACRRLAAAASSPALPLALALRLGLPASPARPVLPAPPSPAAARRLLRSLHRLRRLLGLWRRLPSSGSASPQPHPPAPSLAAFEWAPARAALAASLLAPSARGGVARSPFVTLSIADSGDTVAELGDVPVCVNFVGNNHIVVEPAAAGEDDEIEVVSGSPPEEMYAHFANRRSPGSGRRRRGKHGRRGGLMEAEHFVRIADAEPTRARPLQGLWKGICEDRTLEFYLIAYDDIGGVTCRRFSDPRGQNSGYSPVFWTTDTTFLEPPFSEQELDNYSSRYHIQGVTSNHADAENRVISRILCINSSHDVVDPQLSTPLDDARSVEGRIWLYEDGTFGFGFVGTNSVIDLRHVSSAGCVLDT
ncbi:hypothetical protein PAHAL_3G444900 [Panicum hallii]|uniref:F-box domain-containing protein n=1 Tax=Panicum hallii TaxID=206008 RepID=A0A2S3HEF5_9POAL|nr:F-box protein At3g12350 [Panicum hallii]PAN21143.1 hypothetical protein PAHAL_3G444900 [Panicum hallii]